MTKAEFIAHMAKETGIPKTTAEKALPVIIDCLVQEVKAGHKFTLPGLGTFSLTQRAARKGRNPRTGEALEIPASSSVRFKPSKTLKEALGK